LWIMMLSPSNTRNRVTINPIFIIKPIKFLLHLKSFWIHKCFAVPNCDRSQWRLKQLWYNLNYQMSNAKKFSIIKAKGLIKIPSFIVALNFIKTVLTWIVFNAPRIPIKFLSFYYCFTFINN
jgi:membrane protein required for beta-lactamase induction